jgi:hypothetical protein
MSTAQVNDLAGRYASQANLSIPMGFGLFGCYFASLFGSIGDASEMIGGPMHPQWVVRCIYQ